MWLFEIFKLMKTKIKNSVKLLWNWKITKIYRIYFKESKILNYKIVTKYLIYNLHKFFDESWK